MQLRLEKNGLILSFNRVSMVRNVVEQAGTTMVEASQDCPAFRSAEAVGTMNSF